MKESDNINLAFMDMIEKLEEEKALLESLIRLLEQELDYISKGNAEALEESMPDKQKILTRIADNRKGFRSVQGEPSSEQASHIRELQQTLASSWEKVNGMNNISKSLVTQRLAEIQQQLEPFFAGLTSRYDKAGKKSNMLTRTIKAGV